MNAPYLPVTREELLAELRRLLDPTFAGPLVRAFEAGTSDGWEMFVGFAAIMERVSLQAYRTDQDYRVSSSAGGSVAQVSLSLTRLVTTRGIILKEGTVHGTSDGRRFVQSSAAEWAIGDGAAKVVTAFSVGLDYQQNVLPGQIDRVVLPLVYTLEGVLGDPLHANGVEVTNPAAASGGRPDVLSLVAAARGVLRRLGETDVSLKARARQVADVVSPAAIKRLLRSVFEPYGLNARYWEGLQIGPAADSECSDEPGDDIRDYTPHHGPGVFFVEAPTVPGGHSGCFADDGAADSECSDGSAIEARALAAGLVASLTETKGGGIGFAVVRLT